MNTLSLIVIVCQVLSQPTSAVKSPHYILDSAVRKISQPEQFRMLLDNFGCTTEDLRGYPILFPINMQDARSSRISSGYGRRLHPISNKIKTHKGIDIAAPEGTPVYCAGNGRVVRAGYNTGYGWFVEIEHAGGFSSLYGHLDRV